VNEQSNGEEARDTEVAIKRKEACGGLGADPIQVVGSFYCAFGKGNGRYSVTSIYESFSAIFPCPTTNLLAMPTKS
jgi:hypothetical protein